MEYLVDKYPNKAWDWQSLSSNSKISFEFITNHPNKKWNPEAVSRNPSVTDAVFRANRSYRWSYRYLCTNPSVSFSLLKQYVIDEKAVQFVDWRAISCHPSVTMTTVMQYPKMSWDDQYLSANPNLSSNFILNEGKTRRWFAPFVCRNPGITSRDILKSTLTANKTFTWDYRNLSCNPNLPIQFVQDNLSYDWNFHTISMYAIPADVDVYFKVPWDAHGLSLNRNITWGFIQSHTSIDWDKTCLLMNPGITLDIVQSNRDWFFSGWTDKWSPETFLSSNPNITVEWIEQNIDLVDWSRLSKNEMKNIVATTK